jgi:hypothetical protein
VLGGEGDNTQGTIFVTDHCKEGAMVEAVSSC